MKTNWKTKVLEYVDQLYCPDTGSYSSVLGRPATAYGTAYSILTCDYLRQAPRNLEKSLDYLQAIQDPTTGWFFGPELPGPGESLRHNREHLELHLTCTILPALHQFGRGRTYPLEKAKQFADLKFLNEWLTQRDLADAWYEGNNLLFAGQLLHYLHEIDQFPSASSALKRWFGWHDENIDAATGVWGSDRGSTLRGAIYGGYHQLILYFALRDAAQHHKRLVDAVLSIQHFDGGFSESAGGGACEDVDAVDILVNLYKRYDYRRTDIRIALRRCARLILSIQNSDGGFPYKRDANFIHMGMEATRTERGGSSAFSTWFRVHALALMSEVIGDEPGLNGASIGFSKMPSMGWHLPWDRKEHLVTDELRDQEKQRISQLRWNDALKWSRYQKQNLKRSAAKACPMFLRRLIRAAKIK